jgi:hypothetical protein
MIKQILKFISWAALLLLVLPGLLYLMGKITLDQVKTIMLIATIIWFITATLWMWESESPDSVENSSRRE